MVSIEVSPRSRNLKTAKNDVDPNREVSTFIKTYAAANKISPFRIRLTQMDSTTNKHVPLDVHKSFSANGLERGAFRLYAKDLGPQISWTTVFVIEYLGPLLFHPFFYYLSSVYTKGVSTSYEHTQTETIAFVLVMLHFFKREFETLFVHRFSLETMPARNIFKNSSHYWILSGFNLSFFIYSPSEFKADSGAIKSFLFKVLGNSCAVNYSLVALWAFAEISNLITHIKLAGLRSGKGNERKYTIPHGYGFDWVVCPNYFFESLSWFCYALIVGNWSAWLFLAVSTTQMFFWAIKKHKRYLKTFGGDYKKLRRSIYIPFVY